MGTGPFHSFVITAQSLPSRRRGQESIWSYHGKVAIGDGYLGSRLRGNDGDHLTPILEMKRP